jgi:hypothetical protein
MKKIATALLSVILITLSAACSPPAGGNGVRTGKISDQRLGVYTPIRRLTYRNACGSEWPLTVCVDRITLSDTTALVEARIKNAAPESYVQNATDDELVILADKNGRTLGWNSGKSTEYPGMKEKGVSFRMEGHFSGEPYAVMLNSIRRKTVGHTDQSLSVVAMLGGK